MKTKSEILAMLVSGIIEKYGEDRTLTEEERKAAVNKKTDEICKETKSILDANLILGYLVAREIFTQWLKEEHIESK